MQVNTRKQSTNSAEGKRVVTLDTQTRRLAKDFPGWDAPNHLDFLLETPAGILGTIIKIEHHGSNPWTRYYIRFDDGSVSGGMIIGKDVKLA